MALDVTIAPTVGAPVLFTDGGIGESPGYTMVNLRRMIEASAAFQEGVLDPAGWKVTEKAGGTNMSVDVAADVGLALVDGDANDDQSRYIVAPHTAVANLGTIPGNTSGNPRLDYVVLQVRDDTFDSSGEFDARVRYLAGTATSGATHDNPVGAPTVPDSAILLTSVLVPTGTTAAITNSMIRDRRPYASGAHFSQIVAVTKAAGAAAWAAWDDTNYKRRFEIRTGLVLISARVAFTGAVGDRHRIGCRVDGSDILLISNSVAGATWDGSYAAAIPLPVSPGSRVISPVFWFDSSGGGQQSDLYWDVREIPVGAQTNGTA